MLALSLHWEVFVLLNPRCWKIFWDIVGLFWNKRSRVKPRYLFLSSLFCFARNNDCFSSLVFSVLLSAMATVLSEHSVRGEARIHHCSAPVRRPRPHIANHHHHHCHSWPAFWEIYLIGDRILVQSLIMMKYPCRRSQSWTWGCDMFAIQKSFVQIWPSAD